MGLPRSAAASAAPGLPFSILASAPLASVSPEVLMTELLQLTDGGLREETLPRLPALT